jgi:hypothetical protein
MEAGYISKAPMCAGRLEAVTHWLRYGRGLFLVFSGNSYFGIRVQLQWEIHPRQGMVRYLKSLS